MWLYSTVGSIGPLAEIHAAALHDVRRVMVSNIWPWTAAPTYRQAARNRADVLSRTEHQSAHFADQGIAKPFGDVPVDEQDVRSDTVLSGIEQPHPHRVAAASSTSARTNDERIDALPEE